MQHINYCFFTLATVNPKSSLYFYATNHSLSRCQQAEKNRAELKNGILQILLIFMTSNIFGQISDRTYLRHDHNFGNIYTYGITEYIIHPDSTYTSKSWFVLNKKEWKNYKNNEPEISKGKIKRNGNFYILTEYRNGNKTDFNWTVKISDERLNFYSANDNGKYRKTAKYKRIE